jgi:Na+/proline symporter
MTLTILDWTLIAAYFVVSAAIGLWYSARGGRSVNEFFLTGRSLPWWLAGTSMVTTTFAADTPLVVTGIVAANGVAGNWLWWNMLMSGMLTVFFFARLWRRANVMTDVEFAEIRYSGNRAAFLRGFRALYLALPINLIILGWVTRAMIKILTISLGLRDVQIAGMTVSGEVIAVGICFLVTMSYSVAAGNSGTDIAGAVPANFPEVLTVTAMSDNDGKAGGTGGSPTACAGTPDGDPSLARLLGFVHGQNRNVRAARDFVQLQG